MQMQPPHSHHRAPSTGSAPAQHFMSQEQAEKVKHMLQQIDEQMIRDAQRMSARTHTARRCCDDPPPASRSALCAAATVATAEQCTCACMIFFYDAVTTLWPHPIPKSRRAVNILTNHAMRRVDPCDRDVHGRLMPCLPACMPLCS